MLSNSLPDVTVKNHVMLEMAKESKELLKKIEDTSNVKTFALVGETSTGKSSFVNALAGGFVSCMSIQKEINSIHESISVPSIEQQNETLYQFSKFCDPTNRLKISMSLNNNNNNEDTKLPTPHDLPDFNLFDFPGLNDKNDRSYKALCNQIANIDLIIFVTDTAGAVNKTTAEKLDQIIALITFEEKNNYHYIDLIVIVNKLDEVDNEVMNKLCTFKINNPNDKIFRVSSHLMLIDIVIKEKIHLHVPEFIRKKEIIKICKNANVQLRTIQENLNESGVINHNNLQYDLLDEKSSKYKLIGDWDNLIDYLSKFRKNYDHGQIIMLRNKFDEFEKACMVHYNGSDTYINQFINSNDHIREEDLIRKFDSLNKKKDIWIIEFENRIVDLLVKICNNYRSMPWNETFRFRLMTHIFKHTANSKIRDMVLDLLIDNKYINILTHVHIFYLYDALVHSTDAPYTYKGTRSEITWIKKIFWNHYVYRLQDDTSNGNETELYRNNCFSSSPCYEKIPGVYKHESWFINNLINNKLGNQKLKSLLVISITPLLHLKIFRAKGIITDELLATFDPKLPATFDLMLTTMKENDLLEDRLFYADLVASFNEFYTKYDYCQQLFLSAKYVNKN